jgi:endonuclease YncB( thermonuclease family)
VRSGVVLFLSALFGLAPVAAIGQLSVIQGPVEADVREVTDADTLKVAAYGWPDELKLKDVRIRGVDSPELRGRCQYEKDLARAAKLFVEDLVAQRSGRVRLTVIGCNSAKGGGFGRCLSNVYVDQISIADALISKGLARPNFGEARRPWCPAP